MASSIRRIAALLTALAALAAIALLLAVAIGPRAGWYRTEVVLSGSMQPSFAPGDLLVVRPEPTRDLRVGQVISYAIPIGDRHVESHRVVRILHHGAHPVILTKGDANAAPDPWRARLSGTTVWRLTRVVPGAGRPMLWLRSPLARWIDITVVPVLLLAGWLVRIWLPRERSPVAPA